MMFAELPDPHLVEQICVSRGHLVVPDSGGDECGWRLVDDRNPWGLVCEGAIDLCPQRPGGRGVRQFFRLRFAGQLVGARVAVLREVVTGDGVLVEGAAAQDGQEETPRCGEVSTPGKET